MRGIDVDGTVSVRHARRDSRRLYTVSPGTVRTPETELPELLSSAKSPARPPLISASKTSLMSVGILFCNRSDSQAGDVLTEAKSLHLSNST